MDPVVSGETASPESGLADSTRFEDKMPIKEQHRNLTHAGKAPWLTVNIHHVGQPINEHRRYGNSLETPRMSSFSPVSCHLFEETANLGLTFPERFPRLMFAVIAVALFAFTAAAEYEYLRAAGYYWR